MSYIITAKGKEISETDVVKILQGGGIGVFPTDTLYGVVCSAFSEQATEKIYELKGRQHNKPYIILLPNADALSLFDIQLPSREKQILQVFWPGPVSIIVPCVGDKFTYLHRGVKSLAFRVPNDKKVLSVLKQAGPIVAPSANPEGVEPAKTIQEAREYFDEKVDFYWDKGMLQGAPSTLIKLQKDAILLKREGVMSASDMQKKLLETNIHISLLSE